MKEFKYINSQENITYLWIRKLNIVKMAILLKLIYTFNIPYLFFQKDIQMANRHLKKMFFINHGYVNHTHAIMSWLNGHELEQTPKDSGEQGSLACCSPLGHKELDTTYWLNNNINQKNNEMLSTNPIGWLQLKGQTTNFGEDVKKVRPSHNAEGAVKQCSHVGKTVLPVSQNVKLRVT